MDTKCYHAVELRIFERKKGQSDYPVELRVPEERDFPQGELVSDLPERLRACADPVTYGRALGAALFAGNVGGAYSIRIKVI